jgi:hypothetical protein
MRLLEKIGKLALKISSYFIGLAVILMVVSSARTARAANDINVTASVDRNSLNPDDTLVLTIAIISSESMQAPPQPTLPPLNDFEVLHEWSTQSQQATMVSTPQGPQFKRINSWISNFQLQPKRQGTLTIGASEVVIDGRVYHTKPIGVKVAPGAGLQAPSNRGRQANPQGGGGAFPPPDLFDDEEDDIFSQLLRRAQKPDAGSRTLPVNPQDAFFVQVESDKTEAYVGEQVTVSFFLYTRGLIKDLDTLKYPSLRGFWKEDIEIATHLNFQEEVVNGVPYKKALLASFALFPIKEGSATVDEYKAKCSVISSMDAFGGFGKAYTYTKSSLPVKITVKALPTENRPTDFSGAVGEFQFTSRVEDKNIVEGQPFTLKVRFEGKGNAKLIDLPPLQPPEGIELYDTQNEAKFFRTGTGYKEFKVMMIPRREGDFTIPSVSTSVFDPTTKQYMKKSTEPITIHVGKNRGAKAQSLAMPEDKDGSVSSGKKAAIEPQMITDYREPLQLNAAVSTTGWGALFIMIILTLIWRAKVELGWGQKKKDLMRLFRARLKRVEARAEAGDWRGVGTEMTNTVYFVLGTLVGESGANVEIGKLLLKAPPSVRTELAEPIAKQMEVFQILTFAPEGIVGNLKDPAQLKKAIVDMEKLMIKAVSLGLSDEESSGRGGGSAQGPRAS